MQTKSRRKRNQPPDDESDTDDPEAMFIDAKIPDTWEEAMRSPQKDKWITAMESEMATLREREVWGVS